MGSGGVENFQNFDYVICEQSLKGPFTYNVITNGKGVEKCLNFNYVICEWSLTFFQHRINIIARLNQGCINVVSTVCSPGGSNLQYGFNVLSML